MTTIRCFAKYKTPLIGVIAGALMLASMGLDAQDIDEDGCWFPKVHCLKDDSEWTSREHFISYLTNNCGLRVYVRHCNQVTNMGSDDEDCGSAGLRPGARRHWKSHRDHNPTGVYGWYFVGSTKPSKDWVCSGKVSGWHDPMFDD